MKHSNIFLWSQATVLAAVVLVTGCASTSPTFEAARVVPEQWQQYSATQKPLPQKLPQQLPQQWWREFSSAELERLIGLADSASFSLQVAVERIEQARAQRNSSRSVLWPQADIGYGINRNDSRDEDDNFTRSESDQVSLGVSYEVDLWGRVRAAIAADNAALEATIDDYDAARLALQAEVAAAYFQWLAATDRINYARENLTLSEEVLRLITLQHREGASSRLELVQQQAAVAAQQRQINDLYNSRRQAQHSIALLTGQRPDQLLLQGQSLAELKLPELTPTPPAALLQQRPDIRAAERNLAAADANIDQARAAFYPGLRLSGSIGRGDWLLNDPVTIATSLAASFTQPLFSGGQLRADLSRAQSRQRELLASYYQTVLTAVVEAEDALSDLQASEQNVQWQRSELELTEEAFQLADKRYRAGAEDFFTLLDAQRSLISNRDSYVQYELSRYLVVLDLYRAVGGSIEPSR